MFTAVKHPGLTCSDRAIQSTAMGWIRGLFGVERTVPPQATPSTVTIVRRGLSPAYYFFFEIFAKQNGIKVVVDRRVDDRRARLEHVFGDRRASDRRLPPPRTWGEADLVIPQPTHDQPDAPRTSDAAVIFPLQR